MAAALLCLHRRASPSPVLISGHEGRFRRYEMSASFIANSSAVLEPLSPLLEDVSRLMSAGAYLHQYARFGMEEENVRECVAAVEDTAARYGMLRASG